MVVVRGILFAVVVDVVVCVWGGRRKLTKNLELLS